MPQQPLSISPQRGRGKIEDCCKDVRNTIKAEQWYAVQECDATEAK
jgi:hypothetical protein